MFNRKHGLAVSILFISSVGWGLTWLPVKSINQMGLDGMHLVFIACASAGLLLSPILVRQLRFWTGSFRYLLLIGLFGGVAYLTFQISIVYGNVVRVMILFYLLPVWSVLGGWYILKERPDWLRVLAVIISLSGAMLILGIDSGTFTGLNWLDVMAIIAGVTFALNNIMFRKTAAQPIAGKVSVMFLGCAFLTGGYLLLTTDGATLPNNMSPIYAAGYGVLILSVVTFGSQWGVTQLEAGRAALIIVMELVTAVVSVALLTDIHLSSREIIGGLMVLTAAMIEAWHEPEEAMA
jgi:drug/metabolite transporter (DMT)-like permease